MKTETLKGRLLRSSILAGVAVSVASVQAPAFAQDDAVEEIFVTGSRIPKQEFAGTSPVTVVGAVDLSLSNTVNAEQFLNTLPQAVPGFDATSNNPGLGESTVNLRGLGSVRTLVLVNGRRYVSSNQNPGVVDINTIPASLIKRIDIVTGGQSAVYGSDAMAGVVNFIMKDDYEGVGLDMSYQMTEENDGEIFDASITMGGNIADGRGNAVLFAAYTDRSPILQGDRDESFVTLVDTGTGLAESGSVNIPSTFVFDFADYTAAGIDALPCALEGSVPDATNTFCTTDSFGWIFNPAGAGAIPFINSGPNTNRYNYAPLNYLQIPQERYTLATFATYQITDDIEAYGQGTYVSSQTEQLLAPSPVFTTLTVNLDNPFLGGPGDSAWELLNAISGGTDSDGNLVDDAVILAGRRMQEVGGRLSDIRNDSFQISGGLRGDWEAVDGGWDVYASFGQAGTSIIQSGNIHVPTYQQRVRDGLANIFVANGLTDADVDAMSRTGAIVGTTEQTIVSASMYGNSEVLSSPFAESGLGYAAGVEYREEDLETYPDSVLGPDVAGFNQGPAVFGNYDSMEYFAEASLALVEGYEMAEEITLTGAYRISDYSTVGNVSSYAGGLSWVPVEGLRFRGQYQRAVRAPNAGELFAPQTNGFPNIADPCSGGLNGGYGGLTAAEQAAADVNCAAGGVPAAAVGTPFQVNAQIEGLFGGNPNLGEESSDTYTYGVVWQPDSEMIPGNLSMTLDYFDIQIENIIGNVPSQQKFDLCYVEGIASFCSGITRLPSGAVDIFESLAVNSAVATTKGVDLTIDYSFELADFGYDADWGQFSIYSLGSYVEEASSQALPISDVIYCAGKYGTNCGEPTPEYKFNTRFDWENGPYAARLRWQYISDVDDDVPAGKFIPGVDSQHYFDLTGYYQANENVLLSLGIQNLTGTDYVIIGDGSAEQSNTYPATYRTLGRQMFARISLKY